MYLDRDCIQFVDFMVSVPILFFFQIQGTQYIYFFSKEKFKNCIKTKMEHNIPSNIMRLNQCKEERINILKKKKKAHTV